MNNFIKYFVKPIEFPLLSDIARNPTSSSVKTFYAYVKAIPPDVVPGIPFWSFFFFATLWLQEFYYKFRFGVMASSLFNIRVRLGILGGSTWFRRFKKFQCGLKVVSEFKVAFKGVSEMFRTRFQSVFNGLQKDSEGSAGVCLGFRGLPRNLQISSGF